jgi:hypothetical protein
MVTYLYLCEFNSVDNGMDIAYYMQGPMFESQTPHFSTFKMCELTTSLLDKKNGNLSIKYLHDKNLKKL